MKNFKDFWKGQFDRSIQKTQVEKEDVRGGVARVMEEAINSLSDSASQSEWSRVATSAAFKYLNEKLQSNVIDRKMYDILVYDYDLKKSQIHKANVDDIIRWESGEMSQAEEIKFFQGLVNTGECWRLQGAYGRQADAMLEAGVIKPPKNAKGKDYYGNDLKDYYDSKKKSFKNVWKTISGTGQVAKDTNHFLQLDTYELFHNGVTMAECSERDWTHDYEYDAGDDKAGILNQITKDFNEHLKSTKKSSDNETKEDIAQLEREWDRLEQKQDNAGGHDSNIRGQMDSIRDEIDELEDRMLHDVSHKSSGMEDYANRMINELKQRIATGVFNEAQTKAMEAKIKEYEEVLKELSTTKDMGIAGAGPIPNSGLAAQDLENEEEKYHKAQREIAFSHRNRDESVMRGFITTEAPDSFYAEITVFDAETGIISIRWSKYFTTYKEAIDTLLSSAQSFKKDSGVRIPDSNILRRKLKELSKLTEIKTFAQFKQLAMDALSDELKDMGAEMPRSEMQSMVEEFRGTFTSDKSQIQKAYAEEQPDGTWTVWCGICNKAWGFKREDEAGNFARIHDRTRHSAEMMGKSFKQFWKDDFGPEIKDEVEGEAHYNDLSHEHPEFSNQFQSMAGDEGGHKKELEVMDAELDAKKAQGETKTEKDMEQTVVMNLIKATMSKLSSKIRRTGVVENFGDNEMRELFDKLGGLGLGYAKEAELHRMAEAEKDAIVDDYIRERNAKKSITEKALTYEDAKKAQGKENHFRDKHPGKIVSLYEGGVDPEEPEDSGLIRGHEYCSYCHEDLTGVSISLDVKKSQTEKKTFVVHRFDKPDHEEDKIEAGSKYEAIKIYQQKHGVKDESKIDGYLESSGGYDIQDKSMKKSIDSRLLKELFDEIRQEVESGGQNWKEIAIKHLQSKGVDQSDIAKVIDALKEFYNKSDVEYMSKSQAVAKGYTILEDTEKAQSLSTSEYYKMAMSMVDEAMGTRWATYVAQYLKEKGATEEQIRIVIEEMDEKFKDLQ